jgi:hypothetical protein
VFFITAGPITRVCVLWVCVFITAVGPCFSPLSQIYYSLRRQMCVFITAGTSAAVKKISVHLGQFTNSDLPN